MKYKEINDEYNSLVSEKSEYIKTISTLKEGYISKKSISGKLYPYLQKRINNKLSSEYIRKDELPHVEKELEKRNEIELKIKLIDERLNKLEAAAGILDTLLYRKLIILKRSAVMDSMPTDMRSKSLAFGNAMAALEGLPTSEDTERMLSLWAKGQYSFKDGYMLTLIKYNLIGGVA